MAVIWNISAFAQFETTAMAQVFAGVAAELRKPAACKFAVVAVAESERKRRVSASGAPSLKNLVHRLCGW